MVAAAVGNANWRIAYQSRSGSPRDPWLEPDINDVIRELGGRRESVLVPIGFLCDHVEVLYDLDIEAAQIAREAGVTMVRAATVSDHPQFIEMMAALARARLLRQPIVDPGTAITAGAGETSVSIGATQWTPRTRSRRVAIIGGGITGLAAAFRLRELADRAHEIPIEIALFERSMRVGGALDTIRRDGFVIETGADSFLSEKPAAAKLAERLGLASELIGTQEQFRKTFVVRGGRLVEIPEGFSLLAPTWFGPLLRSPLFSATGKLRMMIEPMIPRRRATADESLGAFVRRRLGREVLARVAQPLAGGIYTADPELLSIGATMPRFVEMERRYGSVIRGLRAAARDPQCRSARHQRRTLESVPRLQGRHRHDRRCARQPPRRIDSITAPK